MLIKNGFMINPASKEMKRTDIRVENAAHKLVNGQCSLCGRIKKNIDVDEWYIDKESGVVLFQNAIIHDVIPLYSGRTFSIYYRSWCKYCKMSDDMHMVSVTEQSPYTHLYYCKACGKNTYTHIKIQY